MEDKYIYGFWFLLAAVVGALVAFVGIVKEKDNSISSFRRGWVESLRGEVANLIANICGIYMSQNLRSRQKYLLLVEKDYNLILMRLNASEDSHVEVIRIINSLQKVVGEFLCESEYLTIEKLNNNNSYLEAHLLTNELKQSTGVIIKDVWEKVKAGEGSVPPLVSSIGRWFSVNIVAAFNITGIILGLIFIMSVLINFMLVYIYFG